MRNSSFTLIELLVAIVIFASISLLTVSAMHHLIESKKQQEEHKELLVALQKAYLFLQNDLKQIINRPVTNYNNKYLPAFIGMSAQKNIHFFNEDTPTMLLEFSKYGIANPINEANKTSLERVSYKLVNNSLYRIKYSNLDSINSANIIQQCLLTDLKKLDIKYISHEKEEKPTWVVNFSGLDFTNYEEDYLSYSLPAAIEISFSFKNREQNISWYFLLPGGRDV